jgi:hypothetical protein
LDGLPPGDAECEVAGGEEAGFDDAPEVEDADPDTEAETEVEADGLAAGSAEVAAGLPDEEPAPAASGFEPPPLEHPATTRTAAATATVTPRIAPPFTPDTAMVFALQCARRLLPSSTIVTYGTNGAGRRSVV